jgi:hypothetical protein
MSRSIAVALAAGALFATGAEAQLQEVRQSIYGMD